MIDTLLILFCGLCNIARGERLFGLTGSTVVGRIVAMSGMAAACAYWAQIWWIFPMVFVALMLWCSFGWDMYWSAAIGNHPARSRLWGVIHLGLCGMRLHPLFGLLILMGDNDAIWGLATVLQGIPYLIAGIPKSKAYSIPIAEVTWGICLGAIFYMTFA